MELNDVLRILQYDRSSNYVIGSELNSDPAFGHIFRKAQEECSLHGAYLLRGHEYDPAQFNVPVVYVCHAESEQRAREIHRLVWNQNIVPFLLVVSPAVLRLYPGFRYQHRQSHVNALDDGAIKHIESLNDVATVLNLFRAECIDRGEIWASWGQEITPESRVDLQLLSSLKDLDNWLARDLGDRSLSHALIGKFVYLHYLRSREIISDRKLSEWGLNFEEILGRGIRLDSFRDLIRHLDEWLNGSVFPIQETKLRRIGAERLRKVAGIFQGDMVDGQLHLDFPAYDFSFIPVETLSTIYEQFLHSDNGNTPTIGKQLGAYYTPITLVNFTLDRLNSRKPLRAGMSILDPACGSGAFLVQCYRKLIEQKIREYDETERAIRPTELRQILTDHLFGLDIDEDACQIAELSLILTLLEYVKPPDLTNTTFKLPELRNHNIFHGNAFDEVSLWAKALFARRFDWVVGNPPWYEIPSTNLDSDQKMTEKWLTHPERNCPTGGRQIAEAFAWRSADLVAEGGVIALVLPAMTLFKQESQDFRRAFFQAVDLWYLANFSNLAYVLFSGRSVVPATVFFYSRREIPQRDVHLDSVEVYSPLLANQTANLSQAGTGGKKVWSVVLNTSEVREVPYREISNGDQLPWKLAMWGTAVDKQVLATTGRRFRKVAEIEEDGSIFLTEGLQLRRSAGIEGEPVEYHGELVGKTKIHVEKLKEKRYLIRFPEESLGEVSRNEAYVRKGRFKLPFTVSKPPHIIISASRNFAVYSEKFIVVPPRQIGMISPSGNRALLKAFTLYLNSDFVIYHQFLTSPESGIQKTRSTLGALRSLPVPFGVSTSARWEEFYDRLNEKTRGRTDFDSPDMVLELNRFVSDALGLDSRARAAVHDLVRVRMELLHGKIGREAVAPPRREEIERYAVSLQSELDNFLAGEVDAKHRIDVAVDSRSAMVQIELVYGTKKSIPVTISTVKQQQSGHLNKISEALGQAQAQWLYFERNLRLYTETETLIFKPLQRLQWTETQAISDAGELIAESMTNESEPSERLAT